MSWYAVDAVTEALDEAKALLLPFDLRRWLVLAIITFFVGGTGGGPSINQTFDAPMRAGELPEVPGEMGVWTVVALVVLVGLALAVIFLVVGSIMEFVFVDTLRSREVYIRGRFGRRLGPGFRLLGFRLLVLLAGLLVVALVGLPVYAGLLLGTPLAFLFLVVTVPLAVVLGLALVLVQDFTTAFVVPIVCDTEGGIVATWRETLVPAVRAEWQQFLLYAVLKWGISIAIGIGVGIALAVVFLPVLVLVGAGLLAGGVSGALVAVGVGIALVLFVLVLVFVRMPIAVFLRYFSLLVLAKTDIEWTLHPDVSSVDDGAGAGATSQAS
jgi:hypothetical protein